MALTSCAWRTRTKCTSPRTATRSIRWLSTGWGPGDSALRPPLSVPVPLAIPDLHCASLSWRCTAYPILHHPAYPAPPTAHPALPS
eukprot:scaffold76547_cov54-Phaeocystis_antarctica.AAC.1